MAEEPRVTRFKINWGDQPKAQEGEEAATNQTSEDGAVLQVKSK